MPIVATPPQLPNPFTPPSAYIQTPTAVRRMQADQVTPWCIPAKEAFPETTTSSDLVCGALAVPLMTAWGACLADLLPLPEVVALPGAPVRFHLSATAGTPEVAVTGERAVRGVPGVLPPWTARRGPGDLPAVVHIRASGERGTVIYRARVVVGTDLRRPTARVNLRRARNVLEVTSVRGGTVTVCANGDERAIPMRRHNRTGTVRFPVPGNAVSAIVLLVRSPAGVSRVYRLTPR